MKIIVAKGNTYAIKDKIKSQGGKFDGKYWVFCSQPETIETETLYFPQTLEQLEYAIIDILDEYADAVKQTTEKYYEINKQQISNLDILKSNIKSHKDYIYESIKKRIDIGRNKELFDRWYNPNLTENEIFNFYSDKI